MDIPTLTAFLMWCSLINGSLLVIWSLVYMLAPDWVYGIHNRWFPLDREHYNLVIYQLVGLFKILFLLFNLVPYIALLLLGPANTN